MAAAERVAGCRDFAGHTRSQSRRIGNSVTADSVLSEAVHRCERALSCVHTTGGPPVEYALLSLPTVLGDCLRVSCLDIISSNRPAVGHARARPRLAANPGADVFTEQSAAWVGQSRGDRNPPRIWREPGSCGCRRSIGLLERRPPAP